MNYKHKEEKNFSNKKLIEKPKKLLYNTSTNSLNFNKRQNNDIMDKFTKILNDNDNKENYDSYVGSNYKILKSYNKSANSQGIYKSK